MIFSTKAGYSLRAIVRLAQNFNKSALSLHEIAKKERISLGYLEKLVRQLKKAGLVQGIKGSTGGYRLTKSPKKITVADVVEAAEGKLGGFYCVGTKKPAIKCPPTCLTKKVWVKLDQQIRKTLESISLNDLIS